MVVLIVVLMGLMRFINFLGLDTVGGTIILHQPRGALAPEIGFSVPAYFHFHMIEV